MVIHSISHSCLNLRDLKNSSEALRVFPQELPQWNSAVGKRETMKIRWIVPLARNKWTSLACVHFHKMDHVILSGEFFLFVVS